MKIVEAEGLTKVYEIGSNTQTVLRNINISIGQSDFVALLGPSGSGKSTFMNMIGCLDRPTSGSVHINGQDITALDASALADFRNKHIGFVFQQYNLLPNISAVENIEIPMIYAGVAKKERREKAEGLLSQMGLESHIDHMPTQMSGGQQQRVAIARALACNPSILLADEPTGALDTATSHELMDMLLALNEDGLTIVLVTHELDIAQRASTCIKFRDGRVERA